ncbi:MAG TPA: hypothetical protein VGH23_10800 [Rhizomicrobium sp.]|jgi:hypothetical protein
MENAGSGTRTFGHRAHPPVMTADVPAPTEQGEVNTGRSLGLVVCAILFGVGAVEMIVGPTFYDDNGSSWGWPLFGVGVVFVVLGFWGIRRFSGVKTKIGAPWVFRWPSLSTIPVIIIATLQIGFMAWQEERIPPWTVPPGGALSQTVGVLRPMGHGRHSGDFATLLMPDGSYLQFTCTPGRGSVQCLKARDFYYPSWIGHQLLLRYFAVPSHKYPDTIIAEIRTPDGIVLLPYEQRVPELQQALVVDHRKRGHPNIFEWLIAMGAMFGAFKLFFRRADDPQA